MRVRVFIAGAVNGVVVLVLAVDRRFLRWLRGGSIWCVMAGECGEALCYAIAHVVR